MIRALSIIGLFFFLSSFSGNTKKYPQDYFRSPVDFPIKLSGTFGELRPNHFHAGIDIKSSNGSVGDPLYAVAEGTISRIKVQAAGYGQVLYLRHPNGYTSVYAHLKEFPEEIAKYVRRKQYEKKTFAVDLYPPEGKFNFKQGDRIGVLGTSGRSYGPHLHFEIRDTRTEKPINPQLFGLGAADSKPPRLHNLKWYGLNDRLETLSEANLPLIQSGSRYRIKGDTLSIGAWRTGFSLKAYDHSNGVSNWNGIYSLEVKQDDVKVYGFTLESFAFSETRYINAHLDYKEQVSNKSYFHRCFRLPGNKLSIYEEAQNEGILTLYKDKASKINMLVKDVAGNTAELEFWVKRKKVPEPNSMSYQYVFKYNEENTAQGSDWKMDMKNGSLYEDMYWRYDRLEKPTNAFAPLHSFHSHVIPVHKYFDLQLKPNDIPESLKSKAVMVYKDKKGEWNSCGGKWNGEFLKARVRNLGQYTIMLDQKAPTITPISFKKDLRGAKKMSFKVNDDIDAAKNIDSFTFTATIDGKWALFEYDAKNDLITHRFVAGEIGKGEHVLKITAKDPVGNATTLQKIFLR